MHSFVHIIIYHFEAWEATLDQLKTKDSSQQKAFWNLGGGGVD